jgi:heme oxygenase
MSNTPELRLDLAQHLRRATAPSHEQLERSLDLMSQLSDRQLFKRVLERFWGFHLVWEAAIRRRTEFRAFHESRSRLPHLRRDLAMLGHTSAQMDRLPRCDDATALADSPAAALGSIYVMEGSTLGGQVIGRGLAQAAWVPTGGLTYFHPYGERTGQMWRGFREWAQTHPAAENHDAVAAGANRTFDLLRGWLA